jgi:hypothetical protein
MGNPQAKRRPLVEILMILDLSSLQSDNSKITRSTRTITLAEPLGGRVVVDDRGTPYVVSAH